MTPPADTSTLPWQIEKIDFSRIQLDRIRDNQTMFYLLTASSFIESGADLYTSNLVDFFAADPEVAAWLAQHWEHEEMQHGRALRMYVQYVWPDFAWQDAFESFLQEYGKLCTTEELEATPAQELAARCVVETGTSSLYRAINACTDEPVLREIADHIRRDEVSHYKNFYHFFLRYRQAQKLSRLATFGTLARRLLELRNSDAEIALRHVFAYRQPQGTAAEQADINKRVTSLIRRNLPIEMTVKMLLKPLQLSPRWQKSLQWPLSGLTQIFMRVPL